MLLTESISHRDRTIQWRNTQTLLEYWAPASCLFPSHRPTCSCRRRRLSETMAGQTTPDKTDGFRTPQRPLAASLPTQAPSHRFHCIQVPFPFRLAPATPLTPNMALQALFRIRSVQDMLLDEDSSSLESFLIVMAPETSLTPNTSLADMQDILLDVHSDCVEAFLREKHD